MGRAVTLDQSVDLGPLLSIYRNLLFPWRESVFFLYTDGKVIDANQGSIELLGYSHKQLCELNITDLISPENQCVDQVQIPSLQINQVHLEERKLRRNDGRVIQVEIHFQKIYDEVLLGIIKDMTSQRVDQEIFHQMEDRYRLIVETATEGICAMNENNLISYVNTRMAEMLGSSEEEMVGKTMAPFLYDEDFPRYWELMALRQQGNADPVERRFRRKDGSTLWVNISPKPVMDGKGVYRGQFAMFTDITKEKQNDEIQKARLRILQIAESHSLDRFLEQTLDILGELTGSPIGFYHFLANDQSTFTRRAWSTQALHQFSDFARNTGHQIIDHMGIWMDCINNRKAVIINDFHGFSHKNDLPTVHGEIARFLVLPVLRGEKVVALLGIGDKSSNYHQQDVDLVSSFADLVWDIAERKIAEQNLRQHSLQYQAIINTSLDGFSMCSSFGKIMEANDAYCRMLGYTRDEILEMSISDIEANEIPEETARHIQAMTENGSERFETRHKCKNGRIIDVEVNTTYMPDIGTFMTFTRDITDRKRVEEALQDNRELLTLFISHSPIYAYHQGCDTYRKPCGPSQR